MPPNTLNICLGHLPFPADHQGQIDLIVAPRLIAGAKRLAIVDDGLFGPRGSALSEYVQLFWILEHLSEIAPDCAYIRIFHYRRLVSRDAPTVGQSSANLPWATTIRESELSAFGAAFDRFSNQELFNTPFRFAGGLIGQYAANHVLADLLNFTNFLVEEGIFDAMEASRFLSDGRQIPSCNIGVFTKETYASIFGVLRRAAEFLNSRYFVERPGYQRRTVGFLLERLNGYLIFKRMEAGASAANFGFNLVISDGAMVSATQ